MISTICKYVLKTRNIEYKELCESNNLHYSPDTLLTILHCVQLKGIKPFLFYLIDNTFLSTHIREFIIRIYCETTKLFMRIKRCILAYRNKRIESCNTFDLSYTPFHEYKPTDYFHLFLKGKKYTLKHTELYNIIESSLLNSDGYMISNPLPIKNPYTGVPFSKNMLYLLFIKMKRVPPLFLYFMKVDFDIRKFLLSYEGLLRTQIIEKTLRELDNVSILETLETMLEDMTIYNFLSGNYNQILLPSQVKPSLMILKPLLVHYYNYMYSMNPYQRQMEYKTLVTKLILLRDTAR